MRKRIFKPLAVMLATYTSIPMPQFEWDEDSTRLAIGYFPLAGVIIGAVQWCWYMLCDALNIGDILFSAVAAAIPVLLTGGIHLDGFCDTVDALSSYQPRERKLEIMKDPNAGAFALIYCCLYMLVCFGLFSEVRRCIMVVVPGYVLSRALSAINAVTIQNARGGKGMLAGFTNNAHKRAVLIICCCSCALAIAVMAVCSGSAAGGSAVAAVVIVTFWYRRKTVKAFGGATGDTSGFYLQLAELAILSGAVIGSYL